jgi:hypothetical protein
VVVALVMTGRQRKQAELNRRQEKAADLRSRGQNEGHPPRPRDRRELKAGPLAHLPSGQMNANGAWLVLAAISFNLTRAAGTLASRFHARATTATIRTHLIAVPARIARSARRLRLHLPERWPWETAWRAMFTGAAGPPACAT